MFVCSPHLVIPDARSASRIHDALAAPGLRVHRCAMPRNDEEEETV